MKLIWPVLALLSLGACTSMGDAPANFSEPFPDNYKQIVIEGIKQAYFDPFTLKDAELSTPKYAPKWDLIGKQGWVVCFKAIGKNRTGAYSGMQETAFMIAGGKVVSSIDTDGGYYCGDVAYSPFPEAEQIK